MIKVEDNLGLVYSTIKKNFYWVKCLEYEDMVQIGMLALTKAAKQYDKNNGAKFSTYAESCIYNDISRQINKEKTGVYRPRCETVTLVSANTIVEYKSSKMEYIELFKDDEDYFGMAELKICLEGFNELLEGFNLKIWCLMLRGISVASMLEIFKKEGYNIGYKKAQWTSKRLRDCFKKYLNGESFKLPVERKNRNGKKSKR